jgi:hypothetical protein
MSQHPDNDVVPLPLEAVSDDDVFEAFFPGGEVDPRSPLGAAFVFWRALVSDPIEREVAEAVSLDPSAWGDYSGVAEGLKGWSLMQFVVENPDHPDLIRYVKLMPQVAQPAKAFADAALDKVQILTVVRAGYDPDTGDAQWAVWGWSDDFPPASMVLGTS